MAMSTSEEFETSNKVWRIRGVRSAFPGHLSGWLVNNSSHSEYSFTLLGGKITYLRNPKPAANIPEYIDEIIKELQLSGEENG